MDGLQVLEARLDAIALLLATLKVELVTARAELLADPPVLRLIRGGAEAGTSADLR